VSKEKLFAMVMTFALLVAVVVGWLVLWVEPIIYNYQLSSVEEAIMKGTVARIVPKQFQSLGKNGVFYAQGISHGRKMNNVFLALENKNWDITVAKIAGEGELPGEGRVLLLKHGARYVGKAGDNNFHVMKFAEYNTKITNFSLRKKNDYDRLSTMTLWQMRHNDVKAVAYLHWRIALPISVFILVLLAMPLSQVNPRLGKFARLLPAILIYTAYADLLFLGRAWITSGVIDPVIGLWWLHGLMLLLALVLMEHESGWNSFKGLIPTRAKVQ
jgi:lipopolysaccharide export system permease protein